MIAEDREYAERRLELRQDGSGRFRRNEFAASHSGDDVVSGQEDDVGAGLVDARHDLLELFGSVEGRPHVEVAEERDEEAVLLSGPTGERQLVAVDLERHRLQHEGP